MVDKDEKKAEKTAQVVQEIIDKETEQGFRGVKIDPTPNEAYTVGGVLSGAPTPETDHDAAVEANGGGLTKFNNKGQA
jgi:hypothetical protein